MSNIIKFPKEIEQPAAPAPVEPAAASAAPNKAPGAGLLAGLVKFVWVATVLVWPILKWVLSIATFFQFVRMLYHWNTPGVYAGWSFLAYFAVLTAITAAILRVLQCVAASGWVWVVNSTNFATSTLTGGPPRGKSRSMPVRPDSM